MSEDTACLDLYSFAKQLAVSNYQLGTKKLFSRFNNRREIAKNGCFYYFFILLENYKKNILVFRGAQLAISDLVCMASRSRIFLVAGLFLTVGYELR